MRLFIGVDFEPAVKKSIEACQSQLTPLSLKGRWKTEDNFHLTLRFMGEFDENDLPRLYDALSGCADTISPFELHLGKIGAFDLKKGEETWAVRVLWVGVEGDMKALNELYFSVEYALESKGFPKDFRPYAPHITLGQDLKFNCDFDLIKKASECLDQNINVDCITVFHSESIEGRRVYTPIKRFDIGKMKVD